MDDGASRGAMPQLVSDLPVVNDAALATFEELGSCIYQTSRMGRTRGQDDPSCECTLKRGAAYACTEESGCINRLTQVECMADVCECGKHCKNQRYVLRLTQLPKARIFPSGHCPDAKQGLRPAGCGRHHLVRRGSHTGTRLCMSTWAR